VGQDREVCRVRSALLGRMLLLYFLRASVPLSLCTFGSRRRLLHVRELAPQSTGGNAAKTETAERTRVWMGFEPTGPALVVSASRVRLYSGRPWWSSVSLRLPSRSNGSPSAAIPRDPPLAVTVFSTRRRRSKTEGREARLRRERSGSKGAGGDRRRACGFAPEILNRFSWVAPCALRSGLGRESKTPTPACVGISASRGRDTRQEPEPAS